MYATERALGRTGPVAATAATAATAPSSSSTPYKYVLSSTTDWFSEINKQNFFTAMKFLFYASATLFALFLILVAIHFTIYPIFSFSDDDGGIIPIPTYSDMKMTFTKAPATPDVPGDLGTVPTECPITVGFDTYLTGDFNLQKPPRVILYRAKTPINLVATTEYTPADLFQTIPDTNLIVWLDPAKNDLFVSVKVGPTTVLTTPAIENVPIRKPFRTTIVLTNSFVEVYINGTLQKSMPLPNGPTSAAQDSAFYTVPALYHPSVKVANLFFWPRPVSVRQVRATGTTDLQETFFTASN